VEGPTSVKVGSSATYTGYLIDAQGKTIDSASVSQSFPRPGNYTVTVEVQGYSGSLKVQAGGYEVKIFPPKEELYTNITYTFTAKLIKVGEEEAERAGALKTDTFQKSFSKAGTHVVTHTIDNVVGAKQVEVKKKPVLTRARIDGPTDLIVDRLYYFTIEALDQNNVELKEGYFTKKFSEIGTTTVKRKITYQGITKEGSLEVTVNPDFKDVIIVGPTEVLLYEVVNYTAIARNYSDKNIDKSRFSQYFDKIGTRVLRKSITYQGLTKEGQLEVHCYSNEVEMLRAQFRFYRGRIKWCSNKITGYQELIEKYKSGEIAVIPDDGDISQAREGLRKELGREPTEQEVLRRAYNIALKRAIAVCEKYIATMEGRIETYEALVKECQDRLKELGFEDE